MRETGCDFNPHFRKGSDEVGKGKVVPFDISIHTSAREVTCKDNTFLQLCIISIHTSAREVTAFGQALSSILCNFNPHFRKGSDQSC